MVAAALHGIDEQQANDSEEDMTVTELLLAIEAMPFADFALMFLGVSLAIDTAIGA